MSAKNLSATPKAPIHPLPLIKVPFGRIGKVLVRPLDCVAQRHRFVLMWVDDPMQYPEVVHVQTIQSIHCHGSTLLHYLPMGNCKRDPDWTNISIKCWRTWLISLFMMMHTIGISGSNLCYLHYERSHKPPWCFLLLDYFMDISLPRGILDVIWENWVIQKFGKVKSNTFLTLGQISTR